VRYCAFSVKKGGQSTNCRHFQGIVIIESPGWGSKQMSARIF
jgi:hypothetical protein